jgi:hypothetical protein
MASDLDQSINRVVTALCEQHARIADLKAVGADSSDAERTLRMLESDLETFEDLLKELRRQGRVKSRRRVRPELV